MTVDEDAIARSGCIYCQPRSNHSRWAVRQLTASWTLTLAIARLE